MWNFGIEQKTYEIGGRKIGGSPGERPVVLVGSIFYNKHKIVSDEFAGEFDRKAAEELINRQDAFSDKTGNPCMIDVVASSPEAMRKYLDYVASVTDAPLLVGGTVANVRLAGLDFLRESGLVERVVYNSLNPESKEDELRKIQQCGVKHAIFLTASFKDFTSAGRVNAVREFLPKASEFGIQKLIVDTCVLDVPSLGQACKAVLDVKSEFGLPAGCGAHNAIATWRGLKSKMGKQAVKSCLASVVTTAVAAGADFVLYGPIGDAEYIFPAVSVVDAAYSQLLIEKKIKVGTNHPRYKIA